MTGVPFRPHEVRFAHRAPVDDREHRELFGCPVYFDAPISSMTINRKTMELPMVGAQPELSRILQRHAENVLATLPKVEGDDLRKRTKEAIISGLKQAKTGLADIAKQLGTSDRTLQRRLGELDTSHAKLLDEARSELATRYLGERDIAIAEVAFLLGFADVPSFHRAFRRWTNCTPGEHRRSLSA
jgi:AraC-like DNA-binding protein